MTTKSQKTRSNAATSLLPLFLGILAFFIVVGPRALNPLNIAWLAQGDPATHYLGWVFFRETPWAFPIGLNPNYGIELGSAIIFSDSNPLLAVVSKIFNPYLPETFQYFGFWLLACFCLQSWFGWKLIGLISHDIVIRAIGAGFFTFAPPMLFRLNGHLSLVGHFLITAALYLALTSEPRMRRVAWGTLLVAAAMIHAYMLAMITPIWMADLIARTIRKEIPIRKFALEFGLLSLFVGFSCWQAGYFSIAAGAPAEGFGIYRMNLLSMFDSSGWSHTLNDIPEGEGDYEGFNYLGLGVILLIIFSAPLLVAGRTSFIDAAKTRIHLLLVFSALSIFALSNNIGIGPFNVKNHLPDAAMQAANIFRASGRMFWPVFYSIVFSVIFIVARGYEKRIVKILMGAALIIQILDTHAGWSGIHKKLMQPAAQKWETPLKDPFWKEAAIKYKNVRHIPISAHSANWQTLAAYAGTNRMSTDAVYLARISPAALDESQVKSIKALQQGKFESDSLYILDDISFLTAAINSDEKVDLLARIDGLNVIAPGWRHCNDCRQSLSRDKILDRLPKVHLLDEIPFYRTSTGTYLLGPGWSSPEAWGTWSEGSSSILLIPIPPRDASVITIEAKALVSSLHKSQRLRMKINGASVEDIYITKPSGLYKIKIPDYVRHASHEEYLLLELEFPDAVRPSDIGLGRDSRKLAIGLTGITVH